MSIAIVPLRPFFAVQKYMKIHLKLVGVVFGWRGVNRYGINLRFDEKAIYRKTVFRSKMGQRHT